MNKRTFLFLFLLFIVASLLSSCASKDMKIDSTGLLPVDIDLLNSDKYKEEIEGYIEKLNPEIEISRVNYEFGDLDGDAIPELVLYIERDPEDLDDQGALLVYKLIDDEYKKLDSVPMNYDNANNILKCGMLSEKQAGILISNQVGVKAGVTYAYILEEGKLKSVLNPKRVNLISFYTIDSIQDIDQDGILEFGILTVDPETEESKVEDAEKIILWYKWDGIDGANFVRKDVLESRNMRSHRNVQAIMDSKPGSDTFLEELFKNMDLYSKSELSSLLSSHIKILEVNSNYNSLDIAALFSKSINNSSLLDLLEDYNLTNNRINDINYLKREGVLQSQLNLKSILINNLNKGYYLSLVDGRYLYTPNYPKFASSFSKSLTKELQGYLDIMAKNMESPHMNTDTLLIDKIDLAKRLQDIENYRMIYSYSDNLENINMLYKDYLWAILFLSDHGEILLDSKIVSKKEMDKFIDIVNSYPETYFSQVINNLIILLSTNQNYLNPEMVTEISKMIR